MSVLNRHTGLTICRQLALLRIQCALRRGEDGPAEALALYRAAREVWSADPYPFGTDDMPPEAEHIELERVLRADLTLVRELRWKLEKQATEENGEVDDGYERRLGEGIDDEGDDGAAGTRGDRMRLADGVVPGLQYFHFYNRLASDCLI